LSGKGRDWRDRQIRRYCGAAEQDSTAHLIEHRFLRCSESNLDDIANATLKEPVRIVGRCSATDKMGNSGI